MWFGGREKGLRGIVRGWVGPDEGALARGVSGEFDGHFLRGSGTEKPMERVLGQRADVILF